MEPSRKRPAAQAARTGQAPDADARYTGKYHRSYYGNNAHVSSDGEHQLIRVAVITSANASVADLLKHVGPTDADSLYADKAYDTKPNRAWVRQRSVESQISKKGAHPIKLTEQDLAENRRKSRVRSGIERIFARWKHWQLYRKVRYLGLTLKAVVYNFNRWWESWLRGTREELERRNEKTNA